MNDEEYTYWFRQPRVVWDRVNQKFVPEKDKDGYEIFTHFCGNFQGWIQYRKQVPNEEDYGTYLKSQLQPQA